MTAWRDPGASEEVLKPGPRVADSCEGAGNTRWKGRCRGSTFLVEGLYCHHPSSLIVPGRVEGLELLSFFFLCLL